MALGNDNTRLKARRPSHLTPTEERAIALNVIYQKRRTHRIAFKEIAILEESSPRAWWNQIAFTAPEQIRRASRSSQPPSSLDHSASSFSFTTPEKIAAKQSHIHLSSSQLVEAQVVKEAGGSVGGVGVESIPATSPPSLDSPAGGEREGEDRGAPGDFYPSNVREGNSVMEGDNHEEKAETSKQPANGGSRPSEGSKLINEVTDLLRRAASAASILSSGDESEREDETKEENFNKVRAQLASMRRSSKRALHSPPTSDHEGTASNADTGLPAPVPSQAREKSANSPSGSPRHRPRSGSIASDTSTQTSTSGALTAARLKDMLSRRTGGGAVGEAQRWRLAAEARTREAAARAEAALVSEQQEDTAHRQRQQEHVHDRFSQPVAQSNAHAVNEMGRSAQANGEQGRERTSYRPEQQMVQQLPEISPIPPKDRIPTTSHSAPGGPSSPSRIHQPQHIPTAQSYTPLPAQPALPVSSSSAFELASATVLEARSALGASSYPYTHTQSQALGSTPQYAAAAEVLAASIACGWLQPPYLDNLLAAITAARTASVAAQEKSLAEARDGALHHREERLRAMQRRQSTSDPTVGIGVDMQEPSPTSNHTQQPTLQGQSQPYSQQQFYSGQLLPPPPQGAPPAAGKPPMHFRTTHPRSRSPSPPRQQKQDAHTHQYCQYLPPPPPPSSLPLHAASHTVSSSHRFAESMPLPQRTPRSRSPSPPPPLNSTAPGGMSNITPSRAAFTYVPLFKREQGTVVRGTSPPPTQAPLEPQGVLQHVPSDPSLLSSPEDTGWGPILEWLVAEQGLEQGKTGGDGTDLQWELSEAGSRLESEIIEAESGEMATGCLPSVLAKAIEITHKRLSRGMGTVSGRDMLMFARSRGLRGAPAALAAAQAVERQDMMLRHSSAEGIDSTGSNENSNKYPGEAVRRRCMWHGCGAMARFARSSLSSPRYCSIHRSAPMVEVMRVGNNMRNNPSSAVRNSWSAPSERQQQQIPHMPQQGWSWQHQFSGGVITGADELGLVDFGRVLLRLTRGGNHASSGSAAAELLQALTFTRLPAPTVAYYPVVPPSSNMNNSGSVSMATEWNRQHVNSSHNVHSTSSSYGHAGAHMNDKAPSRHHPLESTSTLEHASVASLRDLAGPEMTSSMRNSKSSVHDDGYLAGGRRTSASLGPRQSSPFQQAQQVFLVDRVPLRIIFDYYATSDAGGSNRSRACLEALLRLSRDFGLWPGLFTRGELTAAYRKAASLKGSFKAGAGSDAAPVSRRSSLGRGQLAAAGQLSPKGLTFARVVAWLASLSIECEALPRAPPARRAAMMLRWMDSAQPGKAGIARAIRGRLTVPPFTATLQQRQQPIDANNTNTLRQRESPSRHWDT